MQSREFAISCETGYKIFDRYQEPGLEALTDRSRGPWRYGNQLPQQVEAATLTPQTGENLLESTRRSPMRSGQAAGPLHLREEKSRSLGRLGMTTWMAR